MADKKYEDILRREAALRAELEKVRALKAQLRPSSRDNGPRSAGRGVRDMALDVLHMLQCVAYSQQVAGLARAVFGRDIAPTRFGTLSRDEERAYLSKRSSPRAVWLCHALTFDHGEPIRRLWARSDWPLADRIVGPLTGRVIYLRLAARLAELASASEWATDPELLKYIAADAARDLVPSFKRGQFPLDEWRNAALTQLALVDDEDAALRRDAAQRLVNQLAPEQLLVGEKSVLSLLQGGRSENRGA
jgi:hypothetical protein